ncbi:MAG: ribonuclease R, partial [Planctomycetota bacterium]
MSHYREAVLRHANDPNYRPVKPKVIAKKLGAEGEEVALIKKEIKALVRQGKLRYGPNHLVCPIDAKHPAAQVGEQPTKRDRPKHVVGTFRRHASGFGFVRPEGTRPSEGRDADIFVPAKSAGDAASGDSVRVRLSGKSGRTGKPEGRVVDVVDRANSKFVGVYGERAGMGLVEIDGGVFSKPIYVGDPGAKGA